MRQTFILSISLEERNEAHCVTIYLLCIIHFTFNEDKYILNSRKLQLIDNYFTKDFPHSPKITCAILLLIDLSSHVTLGKKCYFPLNEGLFNAIILFRQF